MNGARSLPIHGSHMTLMPLSPLKKPSSKPKSALDLVVNQLVRASVGGVPSSLPDEDLDRYVADLILKEAAAKSQKYNKEGVRAYLPHLGVPPCTLPKPNKRFLFNVVKSVDDHNQALIKKEEESARKHAQTLDHNSRNKKAKHRDHYHSEHSSVYSEREEKSFEYQNRSSSYDNEQKEHFSEQERNQGFVHKKPSRSYSPCISEPDHEFNDPKLPIKQSHLTASSESSSSYPNSLEIRKNPKKRHLSEISKDLISKKEIQPKKASGELIAFKGRGEASDGSKMDKYFQKDYDPTQDIEPFLRDNQWFIDYGQFEQNILSKKQIVDDYEDDKTSKKLKRRKKDHKKEKDRKKKHHKKSDKTKRKRKTHESSSAEDGMTDSTSAFASECEMVFKKSHNGKHRKTERDKKTSKVNAKGKPVIREWDIPKLTTGSWDPEDVAHIPQVCPW
ncbi:hypothetical protein G9A89_008925 [Geosiphon pyriformis]|nr:hypothetical protein G9A89_008925 [Geosiphon pyriformis]